jgi:thiol-disulfide isomerase/thioredoxin
MIYRIFVLTLCFVAVSLAHAADPADTDPQQKRILDEYTKQLNASVEVTPATFQVYYDEILAFMRTPISGAADETAALGHVLFTMLVSEFAPIRMKSIAGENRGELWRNFVRGEIERGLKSPRDAREVQILEGLDLALAAGKNRGTLPPEKQAEFGRKLDAFGAKWPQNPLRRSFEERYFRQLEKSDAVEAVKRLTLLAKDPNQHVADFAVGNLEILKSKAQPMQMQFTALDGREVDVAKLRGKVVLIDFWATWCGPCVAELPNVKQVYEKYHAQGFEVIAISAENSGLRPTDSPDQRAAKIAKAREKLITYCREKALPWPQYFDGAHWENPFIKQYAISGIPAMFLLDKTGRVVETNARGEKLEPLVKQLLAR